MFSGGYVLWRVWSLGEGHTWIGLVCSLEGVVFGHMYGLDKCVLWRVWSLGGGPHMDLIGVFTGGCGLWGGGPYMDLIGVLTRRGEGHT